MSPSAVAVAAVLGPVSGPCQGPAPMLPPFPGYTYAYNGGTVVFAGATGIAGGIVADPAVELQALAFIPGSNPPCCTSGSNVSYQWVADGGPVEWTWDFAQTSPADPMIWMFTQPPGTPGFTFTRNHWLVLRYCTCNQPTFWGIWLWIPDADTSPYVPPDLPAFVSLLEGLGVTFTPCS